MRNNHQFIAAHAFTRAHKASARAAGRGDLVAAEKWLKLAERHERLALRLYKLNDAEIELDVLREQARLERKRLRNEAR